MTDGRFERLDPIASESMLLSERTAETFEEAAVVLSLDGARTTKQVIGDRTVYRSSLVAVNGMDTYESRIVHEVYRASKIGTVATLLMAVRRFETQTGSWTNRGFNIRERISGFTYGIYGTPNTDGDPIIENGRQMTEADIQVLESEILFLKTLFS